MLYSIKSTTHIWYSLSWREEVQFYFLFQQTNNFQLSNYTQKFLVFWKYIFFDFVNSWFFTHIPIKHKTSLIFTAIMVKSFLYWFTQNDTGTLEENYCDISKAFQTETRRKCCNNENLKCWVRKTEWLQQIWVKFDFSKSINKQIL